MRITLALALLLALALAGAGAAVYALEARRVQAEVHEAVDHEVAELRALQRDEAGPATGRPFTDTGALLDTFLARDVPADDQILVSWYDGRPQQASSTVESDFPDSALFRSTVRPLLAENGETTVRIPEYGDALVTVQSVRRGGDEGALVVVTYLELRRAELAGTMRTYAVVALLALLVFTALAAWLSGRLLAPLRTLRDTAESIGETDLSRRIPESGNDDLTAVTRTLNGMLDRLEAAFVDQREFLDDAGHELRTPLTVLRGHLELLDAGDAREVAETRALLLDEVDRMSRLVGDLILLAKSDRPDFLTTRPVGVERLTHTLLAKVRVLGHREWRLDGTADAVVGMDEQRVTQAVLQLADNAVKHTSPGDEIGLGSAVVGDQLLLWVRDTGPGVPESDREHVFRRFGRSTVSDHDEGFGLGLSIVRAIADAHGGSVRIEDAAVPLTGAPGPAGSPDAGPIPDAVIPGDAAEPEVHGATTTATTTSVAGPAVDLAHRTTGARFVISLPKDSGDPWPAS